MSFQGLVSTAAGVGLLAACCVARAGSAAPADEIQVIGRVPPAVSVSLIAEWKATANLRECQHESWALGGAIVTPESHLIALRPSPENRPDGLEKTWSISRHALEAGHCGWRLARIGLDADRAHSGRPPPMAIGASTLATACLRRVDCPSGNASFNSDASVAVVVYCRFSVLERVPPNETRNPCAYMDPDRSKRPKAMHVLEAGQSRFEFVLVDLDNAR